MQRIQNRFGTAGLVVAIVALVAAMSGGAYAAAHASKAKFVTKAQVLALIKAHPGPAGANGTNGTNGKDGTSGNDGAPGAPGSPGADGKTVRSGTAAPEGAVTGNTGDFYIRTSTNQIFGPKTGADGTNTGWGSATDLQGPPGNDGSPWVAGTVPSGSLMKGTWSVHSSNAAAAETIPVTLSTAVPVSTGAAVLAAYIPLAAQNDPNQPFGCTGTYSAPVASPFVNGLACFYEAFNNGNVTGWSGAGTNGAPGGPGGGTGSFPASGGGNVFQVSATAAGLVDAYGTWAMNAP